MIKVKKVEAKGLYIFQGSCCANSHLVRNLAGAEKFISSANERFEGYMTIRQYCLSKDTWTLLVELADERSIRNRYLESRKRSKKAKKEHEFHEIWRMISEAVRQWLSGYVKWTNFYDKREGSLRMRTYERYFFEDVAEAELYIDKLINQEVNREQRNPRYRSNRRSWLLRRLAKGHRFFSSRDVVGAFGEGLRAGSIDIVGFTPDVLRQLVKTTIHSHFLQNSSNFTPKKE